VAVVTGQRIDTSAAADAYARHFERLLGTRLDWLPAARLEVPKGTPVRS